MEGTVRYPQNLLLSRLYSPNFHPVFKGGLFLWALWSLLWPSSGLVSTSLCLSFVRCPGDGHSILGGVLQELPSLKITCYVQLFCTNKEALFFSVAKYSVIILPWPSLGMTHDPNGSFFYFFNFDELILGWLCFRPYLTKK